MKWHHANTSGHEVEYEAVVPSSTIVFKAVIEVTPAGKPYAGRLSWTMTSSNGTVLGDTRRYGPGDHLTALIAMVGLRGDHYINQPDEVDP